MASPLTTTITLVHRLLQLPLQRQRYQTNRHRVSDRIPEHHRPFYLQSIIRKPHPPHRQLLPITLAKRFVVVILAILLGCTMCIHDHFVLFQKIQNKLHNTSSSAASSNVSRKLLLHKQHQQLSDDVVIPSAAEPVTGAVVVDDLQQLKLLNRHSCNGALNYEAFEKQQLQLQQLQQQSAHQTKSTEALGVLLQYLVYDVSVTFFVAIVHPYLSIRVELTQMVTIPCQFKLP